MTERKLGKVKISFEMLDQLFGLAMVNARVLDVGTTVESRLNGYAELLIECDSLPEVEGREQATDVVIQYEEIRSRVGTYRTTEVKLVASKTPPPLQ